METATDMVEGVVMDLPTDPPDMDPPVMDLPAMDHLDMVTNHPVTAVSKTDTETDKNMEVMVNLVARVMVSQEHTEAVSTVRATVRMANPTASLSMVATVITMELTLAAKATVTDTTLSALSTEEAKLTMETAAKTIATTRMETN